MTEKATLRKAQVAFTDAVQQPLKSLVSKGVINEFCFEQKQINRDGKDEAFVFLILKNWPSDSQSSCSAALSEFPGIADEFLLLRAHAAAMELIQLWEDNQMVKDGITEPSPDWDERYRKWSNANFKKFRHLRDLVGEAFHQEEVA